MMLLRFLRPCFFLLILWTLMGRSGDAASAEENGSDVARQQAAKRATAREYVERRRNAGDRRIWFADGLKMLNREQAIGLVDGVHPNSLGFYFNALGLEPYIRKALR